MSKHRPIHNRVLHLRSGSRRELFCTRVMGFKDQHLVLAVSYAEGEATWLDRGDNLELLFSRSSESLFVRCTVRDRYLKPFPLLVVSCDRDIPLREYLTGHLPSVVAISGGKGGTGKTLVSVNLAVSLARRGHSVILVDADLGCGDIAAFLGIRPRPGLGDLLQGNLSSTEVLQPGPEGVKLVVSVGGDETLASVTPWKLTRLLTALNEWQDSGHLIILDTAAGVHPGVVNLLLSAHHLLLVTLPQHPALINAYSLLKVLKSEVLSEGITCSTHGNKPRVRFSAGVEVDR